MEFRTNKSIDEVKILIKKTIKNRSRNYTMLKLDLLYQDEIIGCVSDNDFWLEKLTPRYINSASRAFVGVFSRENNCTVIKGRFKFSKSYFCIEIGFVIFVTLMFLSSIINMEGISTQTICSLIFLVLFTVSICIVVSALNIVLHRKDERFIVELLQNLL